MQQVNIMVDVLGRPRICEFGLIPVLEYNPTPANLCSRLRWTAPELLQHDLHDDGDLMTSDHVANHNPQYSSALTRESDIYALAMTAIEIFTGNIPSSDLRSEFQVLL